MHGLTRTDTRRLLVCAALGIEARAVQSDGFKVLRVGAGSRKARLAAAELPEHDARVVVGFGAAVDRTLRPGDVVVASEVRYGPLVVPCPWAGSMTALLQRRGLPAVAGPLATVDRIAFRRGLVRLAADGVTVVDMESFPLVEATDDQPFAVVRVVVDTPDHPLLRPATLRSGIAARARLREIGPVLREWASTLESV
jgi:4-hydroxy-3-methylbut-2-enyl diphosphate reductase